MDINNPFYTEVLRNLNEAGVAYILIGGLAVSYHGYSRYTGGMDLWINPEVSNMDRLYSSLVKMGYSEEIVSEIKKERELENPTPIKLKDDYSKIKVDLMTNTFQKDFSWQECYDHCSIIDLDEVKVPVIHINYLIQMKENTNRLDSSMKDLVDAHELKKIKGLSVKKPIKMKDETKTLTAASDMKRLDITDGDRHITQLDLIDEAGESFKVFSHTDLKGNFKPIRKGQKLDVSHDSDNKKTVLFNPYTGEKGKFTELKANNIQLAKTKNISKGRSM